MSFENGETEAGSAAPSPPVPSPRLSAPAGLGIRAGLGSEMPACTGGLAGSTGLFAVGRGSSPPFCFAFFSPVCFASF